MYRDQHGNPVPAPQIVNRAEHRWRGVGRARDTLRADRDERWTPKDYKKCRTFLNRAEKEGFETIVDLANSDRLFWSSEHQDMVPWFETLKPPWNDMEKLPLADYIATHPQVNNLSWAQRQALQPQFAARLTYGPSAPFEEWNVTVLPIAEHPATQLAQQALDNAAAEDRVRQDDARRATRQVPRQVRVGRPAIKRAPVKAAPAEAAPAKAAPKANRQVRFPPETEDFAIAKEWQPRERQPQPRGSASQEVARSSNWQPQHWV